jgi:hypothetical protein
MSTFGATMMASSPGPCGPAILLFCIGQCRALLIRQPLAFGSDLPLIHTLKTQPLKDRAKTHFPFPSHFEIQSHRTIAPS